MFIAKNKVRMHDTDMAGILYFPRQFRFAHDALEDFVESEGFSFQKVFHEEHFVFVIVHCEADYYSSLKVGDAIEIHVFVEKIGASSFTMLYEIYKTDGSHVGKARTVHVTLDRILRTKIHIPAILKNTLDKHLMNHHSSKAPSHVEKIE
jgi:1,4-dihydroxy-2-naphthoyl-CoA hydrolase